MKIGWRFSLFINFILFSSAFVSFAQTGETKAGDDAAKTTLPAIVNPRPSPTPTPRPEGNFIKNVGRDHKAILLSPFGLKKADLKWLVPLAAATTALLLTDHKTSSWVSRNGSLSMISHGASYGGSVYATGGLAAGLYLIGGVAHNPRVKKTGKLAFEALLDTSLVIGVLKHSMGRLRPNLDSGGGRFFKGGRSFPSGHSSSVWSVATVIAYEYKDRPLVRYGAIAAAIAISLSRYTGRAHFLSEVLTGSAIGFGIGRFVYLAHH